MDNTNIKKCPELKKISAPSLGNANYGKDLEAVFNNIDINFTTLGNHDFIKGEAGVSVCIEETEFTEINPITGKSYGDMLRDCVLEDINELQSADIELADGNILSVFDNFNNAAGSLFMIYKNENDVNAEKIPLASLYYVFLDGRYASEYAGLAESDNYSLTKDLSCIVVYDGTNGNSKFKKLNNAFPTIYFEEGVGLCWEINGQPTGLPVQGIPGKNGSDATMHIVKGHIFSKKEITTTVEITHINEPISGWVAIDKYEDLTYLNNQSALILNTEYDVEDDVESFNHNKFYFGTLSFIDNKLYAYCNTESSLTYGFNNEEFLNAMKSIDIRNNGEDVSSGIKGLFIPLEAGNPSTNTQKVHLLSATSIANLDTDTASIDGLNTDVVFTAVKDINTLNIDDTNQLKVDKYLYLELNEYYVNEFGRSGNFSNANWGDSNNFPKYLKYKLDRIVTDIKSSVLVNTYQLKQNDSENAGSRYFGKNAISQNDKNDEGSVDKVELSTENTLYVNQKDNTISDNHIDSMPESFRNRLKIDDSDDVSGIYRWVLCNDVNDWDIDELSKLSNDKPRYAFENVFKAVFTTTVSPGVGANLMWFNGISIVDSAENTENDKYVINGWSNSDEVFNFVKFVPIYVNDFSIKEDAALNLNYNVNITGDTKNSTRSITVHGDVNCDNLSVYKLSATGEIQNIYTKQDIVGDAGIKLGKSNDESEESHAFNVSSAGNLTTKGTISANKITSVTADIENNLITPCVDILCEDSDEKFSEIAVSISGKKQDTSKNRGSINISANSIDSIYLHEVPRNNINDIKDGDPKPNNKLDNIETISDAPSIKTTMPTQYYDNANIVVTNDNVNSVNSYFKNTISSVNRGDKRNEKSPGEGVSTDTTSFESAKNFNMHRLAIAGSSNKVNYTRQVWLSPTYNTAHNSETENMWYNFSGETTDLPVMFDGDYMHTESITANNIEKLYMQKMKISKNLINRETGLENIDASRSLFITFNNTFFTHVGLYGKNSNGSWPALNSASNMELKVYYKINNELREIKKDYLISTSLTYKFDYSTSSYENGCGYAWTGYSASGTARSDYDWCWRYYAFALNPYNIEIKAGTTPHNNICKAIASGDTVEIYAVPYFNMKAHALKNKYDNRKTVLSDCKVTVPRPHYDYGLTSSVMKKLPKGLKTDFTGVNTVVGYLKFTGVAYDKDKGVASTTICNDGFVTRAGDYVFGLGFAQNAINHNSVTTRFSDEYDTLNPRWNELYFEDGCYKTNIPILFYHRFTEHYYSTNGEPDEPAGGSPEAEKTSKGYACRMDAIPLEDLFNMYLNYKKTNLYGL